MCVQVLFCSALIVMLTCLHFIRRCNLSNLIVRQSFSKKMLINIFIFPSLFDQPCLSFISYPYNQPFFIVTTEMLSYSPCFADPFLTVQLNSYQLLSNFGENLYLSRLDMWLDHETTDYTTWTRLLVLIEVIIEVWKSHRTTPPTSYCIVGSLFASHAHVLSVCCYCWSDCW